TTGDALNLVVEVDEDLVERQFAVEHDAAGVERFRVVHEPALFQDELKDVAKVFVRAKNVSLDDRLADFVDDARVGQMGRVIDEENLAAGGEDFVNHAGRRRDDVHVVFAPEPLLNDLHVEQTEEAAAETESESDRTFRLINERRIVQPKFPDGRLEVLEVGGVDRINAAENHRMDFLKARQRLRGGVARIGNRVANFQFGGRFDVGDEIADVPRIQPRLRIHLRGEHADFLDLVARVVPHQLDRLSVF